MFLTFYYVVISISQKRVNLGSLCLLSVCFAGQLAVCADAATKHDDRNLTTTNTPQTPHKDGLGFVNGFGNPQVELCESSYVQFGAPGNGTVRLPWALPSKALPASLLAWEDVAWVHQEMWQEGTGGVIAGLLFLVYVVSLNAVCIAGKCMGFNRKRKRKQKRGLVKVVRSKRRETKLFEPCVACFSWVFAKNMRKKKGRVMKSIMIRYSYLRRTSFRCGFRVNTPLVMRCWTAIEQPPGRV